MIKSEVAEIKKQFKHDTCSITKLSGCYVDGEKEIKARFTETFLSMPEEETFKYFEIFKKTLSGTIGKNLLNLDIPTETELEGGPQEILLKLRDSELKDEALLDEFYQKVIEMYGCVDNYFITVVYAAYDIPKKGKDKKVMEDASDEVYSYILCSISPVTLSKPGLSYNAETGKIEKRTQDMVVGVPATGFLYPAFNNRSTDIHSVLYYSKDSEELHDDFVYNLLGCTAPMSAGLQKESFQTVIKDTLGDDCDYEIVRTIHEKLNDTLEAHKMKEIPEPLILSKAEVKTLLSESGVADDKLSEFDDKFERVLGDKVTLMATNLANMKVFELKTSDVVLKVTPERTDLVQTKMVEGRRCIVIEVANDLEVNGIQVTSFKGLQ